MADADFGCGRAECKSSTTIAGIASFGTGGPDINGYFDEPCEECAAAWEEYTLRMAWPTTNTLDPDDTFVMHIIDYVDEVTISGGQATEVKVVGEEHIELLVQKLQETLIANRSARLNE